MNVPIWLAAVAALLCCAAAWELAGSRGEEIGTAVARLLERLEGASALAGALSALGVGIERRLERAGLDREVKPEAIFAAKLGGMAAGALAALLAAPVAPGRTSLLVAVALPVGGFVAPDALLERRGRRRHARLVSALPDALDLMAAGAAAGRSPAAALEAVAATSEGPLAAELRKCIAEIACGAAAGEALARLRERVGGPELAAIVAAVGRSQRYGAPLADRLRDQASAVRRDQRRLVEERAARAAPKIQLVIALVLVPSVLLMIVAALLANAGSITGG
ncbi:MAG: tight adherence protein [Solirubrobacterales bacterium]|nr:tight adherence protein [Solirubrobacterales bacterium]